MNGKQERWEVLYMSAGGLWHTAAECDGTLCSYNDPSRAEAMREAIAAQGVECYVAHMVEAVP